MALKPRSTLPRQTAAIVVLVIAIGTLAISPVLPAQAQRAPNWLDTSFSGDGKVTIDFGGDDNVRAVTIQPDGKILVGGYAQTGGYNHHDFGLVRLTADGRPDTSFGGGDGKVITKHGAAGAHIHNIALQPDGKIVVTGHQHIASEQSELDFPVARYNADGSLDASFGTGGKVTTDFGGYEYAFAVAVQSDGKILVAGATTDPPDFALARYNADGSPDAAFGTGGKVTTDFDDRADEAWAMDLQSDGKIVLAGTSSGDFALARYKKEDGSLDESFGNEGKVLTDFGNMRNDHAYSVTVQPNGEIVAMGRSTEDPNDFQAARYNKDGSPDTSFDGDGMVITDLGSADFGYAGTVQRDGKVIVAGYSQRADGTHHVTVLRYKVDGTLDASFGDNGVVTTRIGSDDQVYAVALQRDGKIVVAGNSNIGGNWDFTVTRLHGRAPPAPPPPPPPRDPDPPRNNNNGGGGGGGGGGSRARSTPTPVPNNPPEFEEGAIVTVSVRENSPAGTEVGDPITATDPEGDDVRYELGGRDAELFDIDEDTGQITVAEGATLDYETDKLHAVTVTAEDIDGSGEQATISVNINITDDERLPGKADNYDANRDDALDVAEVLASINDYFDGDLTLEEVIAIINAYLDSGS